MKYIVLDLETNTKEFAGRTASPWVNKIVAYSIYNSEEKRQETVYSGDIDQIVKEVVKGDILIAFNAKFELLYLYDHPEFQEWLQNGGEIYCPQLAEYFLNNMQSKYPSLRETAVVFYGCKEREKFMEEYWKAGKETDEIPKNLVLKDVESDVSDTEVVYRRQQNIISKKNKAFQNLLSIQMDFLLATTEMEFNGIKIDTEVLNKNKLQLEEELKVVEEEMNKIVDEYWHE